MSKIDFKKYLEDLEQENVDLKNENALLKRQLQSANDRAKKNEEAANGQKFGVPELLQIIRQLSHYADQVQINPKPNYPNQTNRQSPAIFKKPLASVVKNSILAKNPTN